MTIDVEQFKKFVVEPVCKSLGANSPAAMNLLLGTAAQETHMGHWLVQQRIGYNGGIGIFQMEAPTYHFCYAKQITQKPRYKGAFKLLTGYDQKPLAQRLATDLMLATFMARLYYMGFPEPLPRHDDLEGLAWYYKKYWNTSAGAATVEDFIRNYKKYVL